MVAMRYGDARAAAAAAIQFGLHVIAEHAQIPIAAAFALHYVEHGFGFCALEGGIVLGPHAHRQAVFNHASVGQINEILESGLIDRRGHIDARVVRVQTQFHTLATLGLQVGVANFQ